jgi:hypothetical protein
MKEGIIRAYDEVGYWIEGGSLAEHLKNTSPCSDMTSDIQYIEFKRIHWLQKA